MSLAHRYRNLHRRRSSVPEAVHPALRLRASLRAETGSRSAIALSPDDENSNVRRTWSAVQQRLVMKAGSVTGRMPDGDSGSLTRNGNVQLSDADNCNVSGRGAVMQIGTVTVNAAPLVQHRASETVTETACGTVMKTETVTVDEKANATVTQTEGTNVSVPEGDMKCVVLEIEGPTAVPVQGRLPDTQLRR